jgi:hypothetical protein
VRLQAGPVAAKILKFYERSHQVIENKGSHLRKATRLMKIQELSIKSQEVIEGQDVIANSEGEKSMSLMKKGVSSATLAANRANAQRSTGPRSGQGKAASRQNAVKHWGRAAVMYDHMAALGEDPRDFAAVIEALRQSLRPRDPFEEMLVKDMADIHWRLRRLIRGETGTLATRRREQQTLLDEVDARMAAGGLHELEPAVVAQLGYAGLRDSPPKFTFIIESLKALDTLVQADGFPSEGKAYFQTIYGCEPSLRGSAVLEAFRHCFEDQEGGRDELSASNREDFHRLLSEEITWFEERAARDRQARAEIEAPRVDSMLAFPEGWRTTVMYQERLERRFERKWRLLQRYRQTQSMREDRSKLTEGYSGG